MYEVRGKESCNIKNAGLIKNKGGGSYKHLPCKAANLSLVLEPMVKGENLFLKVAR